MKQFKLVKFEIKPHRSTSSIHFTTRYTAVQSVLATVVMVISAIGIHKPVSHFLSPHTPWIIPALCSALFIPYIFIAWLGHPLGASICLFLIHETCPMSWEMKCNRRAVLWNKCLRKTLKEIKRKFCFSLINLILVDSGSVVSAA